MVGIYLLDRVKNMRDWLDEIGARTRKQAKYDKEHTTQISLKLNLRTDEDILKWLWKQKSKQGAIKELIRKEIANEKKS